MEVAPPPASSHHDAASARNSIETRKRALGPAVGPAVIASSLASQSLSRLSQRFFLCTEGVERRNPPAFLERFFREGAFKDTAASYLGSPKGGGGNSSAMSFLRYGDIMFKTRMELRPLL